MFSHFATGVVLVASCDKQRSPIGMTVNSKASRSLRPPLLLWSIARYSRNHAAFDAAGHFAVHVQQLSQAELARNFHERDTDRFNGMSLTIGQAGVPLLGEYLAHFQCEATQRIDAGHHRLLIGRLLETAKGKVEPLAFYRVRHRHERPLAPPHRP